MRIGRIDRENEAKKNKHLLENHVQQNVFI